MPIPPHLLARRTQWRLFHVSSTFSRSTSLPLTLVLLLNWYSVADLNADQLFKLQSKYMELLGTIRTYAVNLVDSFDIRDEALGSVLGCWDDNAYQRLFDEASKSPLNKTSVHRESFEKYLKPFI
jgi:hypothetical protein